MFDFNQQSHCRKRTN